MPRRRWVYTQGGVPLPEPVEVGEDFQNTRGLSAPMSDLYMDGAKAPDGTDIGSKRKRRDWMNAAGVADFSDFTETRAQAEAAQAARRAAETRELADTIGRTAHELRSKPRRR